MTTKVLRVVFMQGPFYDNHHVTIIDGAMTKEKKGKI